MKKISICLFIILGMCAACNLQAQDNATIEKPVAPAVNNVEDDTPVAKSPTKSWSPTAAMFKNKYLQTTNAPITQYRLDQLEEEVKDIDSKINQVVNDRWDNLSKHIGWFLTIFGIVITIISVSVSVGGFYIYKHNKDELKKTKDEADKIKKELRKTLNEAKESAKQAQISRLFTEALQMQESNKHKKACELYEEIIKLKPDCAEAYTNWGSALDDIKDYKQACEKYQKAVEIKPNYTSAYNNWGNALATDNNLDEALLKYEKAEWLQKGIASYNIAIIYKHKKDINKCKASLLRASELGTLPIFKEGKNNPVLKPFENEPWFNELNWASEPRP